MPRIATGPRANKAAAHTRTNEVYDLLLVHTPAANICNLFEEKYKLSPKTVWHYITKARKLLEQQEVSKREYKRAKAIKTLEKLYNDAYKQSKLGICLQIQKEINALLFLYTEVTDTPENLNQINIQLIGNDAKVTHLEQSSCPSRTQQGEK